MSKGPRRFSSVGRPIDRRYPTNRAIAGLTLVVAILGFAVRRLTGTHPLESFTGGLVLAIGFFLAWAIARELDPDHDASAFVAAALSLIPQTVLERPDLAGVLLILLLLRIVNRTVGPAAQPLDTIGILAMVGVAVWRGQPLLALAAAGAFGMVAANRELSHRVAEPLVAAVKALPPGAVVAPGKPAPQAGFGVTSRLDENSNEQIGRFPRIVTFG